MGGGWEVCRPLSRGRAAFPTEEDTRRGTDKQRFGLAAHLGCADPTDSSVTGIPHHADDRSASPNHDTFGIGMATACRGPSNHWRTVTRGVPDGTRCRDGFSTPRVAWPPQSFHRLVGAKHASPLRIHASPHSCLTPRAARRPTPQDSGSARGSMSGPHDRSRSSSRCEAPCSKTHPG